MSAPWTNLRAGGQGVGRRTFLRVGLGALAVAAGPAPWAQDQPAVAQNFWQVPRLIELQHADGERISATYWENGALVVPEYTRLSWFLRDRVAHKAVYMSPVLLDILYGVHGWLRYFGVASPVVITSGYRDPQRNATIEGAARNSLHTVGDAVDIRIPSVDPLHVAHFGQWLGGGGVGWYPNRHFTHLDRGRLRAWRGK